MKFLRESKQTDEQKKWFAACKGGAKEDIEFVRKHSHLAGLQDESLTNYKTKTYTQFTGLMYAIVFGNLDIVKLLLKAELLIYSSAKNLVEIPDDFLVLGLRRTRSVRPTTCSGNAIRSCWRSSAINTKSLTTSSRS